MMQTISLKDVRDVLCGFYELDAQGKVVYARLKHDGRFERADDSVIGRDFFAEIFTCRNSDTLRRHFQAFIDGRMTTEHFTFGGNFGERVLPFRIMLVRVAENNGTARKHLFFLDIKPS